MTADTNPVVVNWEDAESPIVKLFVGYDVEGYVEEYELCGDDGYYSPNEHERTILVDAIYGVVSDVHEKLRALLPSPPSSEAHQPIDTAPAPASCHPSHTTRFSDASQYDEICTKCGATDIAGGGWGKLAEPCPAPANVATGASASNIGGEG